MPTELLVALIVFASPADDEAAALYAEGARHYQVEEYEAAIEAFKRSYVLSANAGALYNIAQAYRFRGAGHCRDALKYYRQYLEVKPKATDRAAVEGFIAKMKECADKEVPAAPAPAPVEVVKPPPAPPPPSKPFRWQPVALGLGGLAVSGTGVGLNLAARARYAELVPQCPCGRETWAGGKTMETASWVLVAAGAAVAAGALAWGLLGQENVMVALGPASVTVGARW